MTLKMLCRCSWMEVKAENLLTLQLYTVCTSIGAKIYDVLFISMYRRMGDRKRNSTVCLSNWIGTQSTEHRKSYAQSLFFVSLYSSIDFSFLAHSAKIPVATVHSKKCSDFIMHIKCVDIYLTILQWIAFTYRKHWYCHGIVGDVNV